MDNRKISCVTLVFVLIAAVLSLWTLFVLGLTINAYLDSTECGSISCAENPEISLFLLEMTAAAWGIVALLWWVVRLFRQKKTRLILATLAACLLLCFAVYLLYKRYTPEVETSNWDMHGEWIAFSCTPSPYARSSLYLVRPDGSEMMRLTTGQKSASLPSWSPDGEALVLESPRGELAILKRGAKKLTRLSITDQPYRSEYFPAWSPDGQWIAFISSPIDGDPTLLRVSSDGKIQEPVIHDEYIWGPLRWTPDGQWIIYQVAWEKARKVRFDGSEVQNDVEDNSEPWPDFPEGARDPVRSPDGEWIVFTDGRSQLFRMKADGSEVQQITKLNCSVFSPDWIKMPENE